MKKKLELAKQTRQLQIKQIEEKNVILNSDKQKEIEAYEKDKMTL